jgi:hypothetical protein
MRALLAALVLSTCFVPLTARADVAPIPGCKCGLAPANRDGLALAFAGSFSLLFILGKRRWDRQRSPR